MVFSISYYNYFHILTIIKGFPLKPSIFANMNWLDWILAVAFTAALAFIGSLFLPKSGWALGALVGLVLLYLAKRRRDAAHADQAKKIEEDKNSPDQTK
jgi:hypothetical protein